MNKQLLFTAVSVFAMGTLFSQNADLDQQSPISVIHQSTTNRTASAYPVNNITSTCAAATMCPQSSTNSGSVRGYYFVSPVSFTLCGLLVPTDASTGPQSIEVVKFNGTMPPAYPGTTNSFTSLFYIASDTGLVTPVSCNLQINAGDTIGIYGSRSTNTDCSYATGPCQTSILGNNVSLYRTGMQFPLYNQQMHDVWSEPSGYISRVIMYVDAAMGIDQSSIGSLAISPVPSAGVFKLDWNGVAKANGKTEVYNLMGNKVYESNNIPEKLDLSTLADGVYFINLSAQNARATKRIVIAH